MSEALNPFANEGRARHYNTRPGWPTATVTQLFNKIGLTEPSIVIEIGSGTGKFAEEAAKHGHIVYGVEPSSAMQEQAIQNLLNYPGHFFPVTQKGEEVKLNGVQSDVIVFAQAAHWLTSEKSKNSGNEKIAATNMRTMLKREGLVAIVYYNPIFEECSEAQNKLVAELDKIFEAYNPNYILSGTPLSNARLFKPENYSAFIDLAKAVTYYDKGDTLVLDRANYLKWISSYSFVKPEDVKEGTALYAALNETFDRHAEDGHVTVPFHTQITYGPMPEPSA